MLDHAIHQPVSGSGGMGFTAERVVLKLLKWIADVKHTVAFLLLVDVFCLDTPHDIVLVWVLVSCSWDKRILSVSKKDYPTLPCRSKACMYADTHTKTQ